MKKRSSLLLRAAALILTVGSLWGLSGCRKDTPSPEETVSDCAHAWQEATCTAPATCALCGVTQGDVLPHQGGEATCTEQAICAFCGQAYGSTADHVFDQAIPHDKALVTAATHTESAVYAKSCLCGEISESPEDRFTAGEAAPHQFAGDFLRNETEHWQTCACGAASDRIQHTYGNPTVTAEPTCSEAGESTALCVCGAAQVTPIPATGEHSYGEPTVTWEPTCAEAGESTALCACGASRVTPIPATGAHTYENDICTVCGGAYVCDHQTDVEERVLYLADHGSCPGAIHYRVCHCGEVWSFDLDDLNPSLTCDFDYEITTATDENGNEILSAVGVCKVCGLTEEGAMTVGSDECTDFARMVYDLSKDGAPLLETLVSEESVVDHEFMWSRINVSKYGGCGGTLRVRKCTQCGVISDVDKNRMEELSCSIQWEENLYPDEYGNLHTVGRYFCSDCSLLITLDDWTQVIADPCERIDHQAVHINCRDSVIADYDTQTVTNTHRYSQTKTYLGEGCEEGVAFTFYCSACKEGYGRTAYEHLWEEKTDHLGDYGLCGGEVHYVQCSTCRDCLDASYSSECRFVLVDVDDGTMIYQCEVCGGIYYARYTVLSEKDGDCICDVGIYNAFEKNGRIVRSYDYVTEMPIHSYEYEHDLRGVSCEDGVITHATCRDCGGKLHEEGAPAEMITTHRTNPLFTLLPRPGLCSYHVLDSVEACACGLICYCNISGMDSLVYNEETGLYECPNCPLTLQISNTYEEEGCILWENTCVVISMGEEELFRFESALPLANHSYQAAEAVTSEDGGIAVRFLCSACGDSYTAVLETVPMTDGNTRHEWAVTPEEDITLTVMAWESSQFYRDASPALTLYEVVGGNRVELARVLPKSDSDGTLLTYRLEAGKTYVYLFQTDDNPYRDTMLVFGIEAGRTEQVATLCQHDASETSVNFGAYLHGSDSCEEGILSGHLNTACGCLFSLSTRYHHDIVRYELDLSKQALCGGRIIQMSCDLCGFVQSCTVSDSACSWSYVETLEGSVSVYRCDVCGTTKHTFITTTEKDGNCQRARLHVTDYYRDGQHLLRAATPSYFSDHTYEYEYVLPGATCDEGYTVIETCADCEYKYTREGRGHYAQQIEEELADFGLCGGWAMSFRCRICHTPTSEGIRVDNACTWSLVSSEDGVTVHKCDTCGAERHSFAVEREPSYDGQIPHTETCIYYRDGEEIYRFEYGFLAK